ncbi:hypothetical protein [Streptosporangium sp. 'caverna']|uniref:hypothetical protein n=1 Tax=Streptosporangium sp. 'caverna' TaxID=2202249 RepID=UPI000D7DE7E1|nr:hypothetical protein [Streptosporangium sp. 'caverna']AWS41735.1 hypothetical protein DKM19_10595 [Streptosporangium sp. 'caverna']
MVDRLARVVAAFLVLPALGACSAQNADPLLKDPAQWPLVKLKGLTDPPKLPEEAERVLAQIKVGSYDLIAWIHSSGLCGLSGSDWSMNVDMIRSEGQPAREEGFSGPVEPAVGSSSESKVSLFCTPTRMLIRVEGETSKPSVSGDAVAQLFNGGLNAVVGSQEARQESLPGATVTPGG